jgi:predicted RNA-binding protein YlxR (DUF448 family)
MKVKDELLRLTVEAGGRITLEKTGPPRGRGLYLCREGDCISRFVIEKRFRKRFHGKIGSDDLSSLRYQGESHCTPFDSGLSGEQ